MTDALASVAPVWIRPCSDPNALVPVGEPPQEHDSLQDKLDRMGSVGVATDETVTHDDQLSNSIIAPTERNSTFNNDKVETIHDLFKDMIREAMKISRVESSTIQSV